MTFLNFTTGVFAVKNVKTKFPLEVSNLTQIMLIHF